MHVLNFPEYQFTYRTDKQRKFIFDNIRKKYVSLTPEEWVRQHVVRYLITEKNYPPGLISIEKSIKVHDTVKRTDICVFNRNARPLMIIECKAPEIKVNQHVFDQVARYNIPIRAPFLMVTNGLVHHCSQIDFTENTYSFLKEFPEFKYLIESAER